MPRRDELIGKWRKMHNEELNDLYASLNIVRVIKKWGCLSMWHVCVRGEVYTFLVGKPEGKRPLGRSRSRWKDNTKMDH